MKKCFFMCILEKKIFVDSGALSTASSVLSSLINELQNWRQRQVNFEDSDQILISGTI